MMQAHRKRCNLAKEGRRSVNSGSGLGQRRISVADVSPTAGEGKASGLEGCVGGSEVAAKKKLEVAEGT